MSPKVEQYVKLMKDFTENEDKNRTHEDDEAAIKAGNELLASMTEEEQSEAADEIVKYGRQVMEDLMKELAEIQNQTQGSKSALPN